MSIRVNPKEKTMVIKKLSTVDKVVLFIKSIIKKVVDKVKGLYDRIRKGSGK